MKGLLKLIDKEVKTMYMKQLASVMMFCVSLYTLHPATVGASSPAPEPSGAAASASAPKSAVQGIPSDTFLTNKTEYFDQYGLCSQATGWGNNSGMYYDTRYNNQADNGALRFTQTIESYVDGVLQGTGVIAVTPTGMNGHYTDLDTMGTTVRFASTRVRGNLVDFTATRVTANPRSSQNFTFTVNADTKECTGRCDLVPTPLLGHILDVTASDQAVQQQVTALCILIALVVLFICVRNFANLPQCITATATLILACQGIRGGGGPIGQ